VPLPLSPTDRVALRLPRWLGDAVMAEPVLRAFHAFHAAAGRPGNLALAAPMRLLMLFAEQVPGATWMPTDRSPADRPAGWRGLDAAVLLTGSFRSAWLPWRARVPVRVGWARDGRGWLLTHAPRPAREAGGLPLGLGRRGRWPRLLPRPFGATCVELAHLVGVSVHDTRPRLGPTAEGEAALRARLTRLRLGPDTSFVLASVGARPGSAKGLPPEIWARAIAELHRRSGLPVLVACGPGEREGLHAVLELCERAGTYPCADPVVDLPELVSLSARARLVLAPDNGVRHVAVAAGASVVTFCGPTDPRHSADHLDRQRVLRIEVPCGPCHLERCPLQGEAHHACLRRLDPDAIVAAGEELLALSSAARATD
jgi:heptosyltransferase-2